MISPFMRLTFSSLATLLLACADGAAAQIQQSDLRAVNRVTIDSEIPQPEIPLVQGSGNFKAFMVGGGIGAVLDQNKTGKVFREYMSRNEVDISKIVLSSFTRVIEEDKPFELGADGDATLKLAINNYGFGASSLLGGSQRRPIVNVTASLVSNDGTVIWKKTDFITNLSKLTEAYTYDQLAQDPQLTAKSLEQASVLVAHMIFAEFKK